MVMRTTHRDTENIVSNQTHADTATLATSATSATSATTAVTAQTANKVLGKVVYSFKKTLSGAAPHSIVLATESCPALDNANYRVFIDGEFAGAVCVDESSITQTGFDILNGVAGEIVHVLIIGDPDV